MDDQRPSTIAQRSKVRERQLRVRVFPGLVELALHPCGVRFLALLRQRGLQSKQGARVARMFGEIRAEHPFGVRCASGGKQGSAERLADRVEPYRRLIVREQIGGFDRLLPEFYGAIVLTSCRGDAGVQ